MKKWFMLVLVFVLMTNGVSAATKVDAKTYKAKKVTLEKQIKKLGLEVFRGLMESGSAFNNLPEDVQWRFEQLPVRSEQLRAYYDEDGTEYVMEPAVKTFLSDEDHARYEADALHTYDALIRYKQVTAKIETLHKSIAVYDKAKNYDRALKAYATQITYIKQLKAMTVEMKKLSDATVKLMLELNAKYPATKLAQ